MLEGSCEADPVNAKNNERLQQSSIEISSATCRVRAPKRPRKSQTEISRKLFGPPDRGVVPNSYSEILVRDILKLGFLEAWVLQMAGEISGQTCKKRIHRKGICGGILEKHREFRGKLQRIVPDCMTIGQDSSADMQVSENF